MEVKNKNVSMKRKKGKNRKYTKEVWKKKTHKKVLKK